MRYAFLVGQRLFANTMTPSSAEMGIDPRELGIETEEPKVERERSRRFTIEFSSSAYDRALYHEYQGFLRNFGWRKNDQGGVTIEGELDPSQQRWLQDMAMEDFRKKFKFEE